MTLIGDSEKKKNSARWSGSYVTPNTGLFHFTATLVIEASGTRNRGTGFKEVVLEIMKESMEVSENGPASKLQEFYK